VGRGKIAGAGRAVQWVTLPVCALAASEAMPGGHRTAPRRVSGGRLALIGLTFLMAVTVFARRFA
jgi:hypothetical protein